MSATRPKPSWRPASNPASIVMPKRKPSTDGEGPALCDPGPTPSADGTRRAGDPLEPALLLPAWRARLEHPKQERTVKARPVRIIPRAPDYYAGRITVVEDRAGAEAMLDLARQRPISFAGVDCEYGYSRPGVLIQRSDRGDRVVRPDARSSRCSWPSCWSRPAPTAGPCSIGSCSISAGPRVLGPLAGLLRQPIPFVAHFVQSELFCLWQLGLPTPDMIWDTCTAERAFQLGLYHVRYKKRGPEDEVEQARLQEEAEEDVDFSCGLLATCLRRGVPHAFAADKDRLQQSFLDHPDGRPFSDEQRDYVAADAEAAARLYPIQVQAAVTAERAPPPRRGGDALDRHQRLDDLGRGPRRARPPRTARRRRVAGTTRS